MRIWNFFPALLIALLALTLPVAAAELTPAQIQSIWAKQGFVSGTFATQYSDGSTESGTFTLKGPSQLVMSYPRTNGRTTFRSDGIVLEDIKYPSNSKFISDQRLGRVFSSQPSFANLVNRTGGGGDLTLIGFVGSDVGIRLLFSNSRGRLHQIVVTNSDGTQSTTQFNY